MKAHFHLAADLDMEIEPKPLGKLIGIRLIRGVDFDIPRQPFTALADGSLLTSETVVVTKPEARAIASALMGCAAEV